MSTSAYTRQWREEFKARDPEGYKAYRAAEARKYREKHPEVQKAADKRWRESNVDKRAALTKAWFDAHPGYGDRWRLENIEKWVLKSARSRAKQKGLPFDIIAEDVEVPEYCPVLGIKLDLEANRSQSNSISLDRIIPAKGYVKGNVRVISARANRLKSDASVEEVRAILAYMERELG